MERKIAADLHTHSKASDGEYWPRELVKKAGEIGLKAIALTDHDTIFGLREALKAGEEYGVKVICGSEVSIVFKRPKFMGSLHYLLYFSPSLLDNADFNASIAEILAEGRGERLISKRVEFINMLFGPDGEIERILKKPLDIEDMKSQGDNITRRHFANTLANKHGLDKPAISRLISNDSPAYVPSGIDMNMLKPLFEKFPIVSVLAHPAAGSYPYPSIYKEVLPPVETVQEILPEFLEVGLDGLEIYYPGHTSEHIEVLKAWAEKYNLIITGGSDCHDSDKRPLGTAGVEQSDLDILLSRIKA